ncbi:MAG: T9SS type A sorting domain-containing protein [Bacteroidia bacterium]
MTVKKYNVQFKVVINDTNATIQWQTDVGFGFQNLSNAGQYSGVTTNTLTVSNVSALNNSQLFRCIVTSGMCADTSDIVILTVLPSSINENKIDNSIYIYPNPSKNIINIYSTNELNDNYVILDFIGKEVMRGNLKSEKNKLNITNLKNGLFFLKIEGINKTYIIIKN